MWLFVITKSKHPRIKMPKDVPNCSRNIGVYVDGYGVGGDEINHVRT